mmetsp:Transcript_21657/g.47576  ORF Transcript_21657/g.47576 Transcript_21657/m.47576 type:complete len:213 (+) Transcript_21657:277-915(+)|eukprot:CAMPEP_0118927408 /NCGR_PEP_ID=MMETSP1169-20130426/4882_1 /TAXON_ID=36882 /ORGANISM="Pyramimonas obovata, Strain CCMP722" /LENGTH=212 /DNA_ID=CAMNT_0006869159 /DNA_START=249 /DNA_END=887 /DNA_ORIENTATION=-
MDWSNVTASELLDALREAEWNTPPRSPKEFFAKFTPPKTAAKWQSRLKCNVYYYRTNYFIIMVLALLLAFYRNPWALFSIGLMCFAMLCTNDSFATSFSDRVTRLIKKVNPQLAAKLRNAGNSNLNLAPSRKSSRVSVLGFPRVYVVLILTTVSLALIYFSSALWTVSFYSGITFGVILSHASMRTPNLKARLASAREEFRAVWRGYNDYTI